MFQKYIAMVDAMVLNAEVTSAFTTAVLFTAQDITYKMPAAVQQVVNKLRKFTNVLAIPIRNQLDFNACLEKADVIVNMLSLDTPLPAMYIGMDHSQGMLPCATKSTCVFNYSIIQDERELQRKSPQLCEKRADVLCQKVEDCLQGRIHENKEDTRLLCLIS